MPLESRLIAGLEAAAGRPVSRETCDRLQRYSALLAEESKRQNLVSRTSLEHAWDRHTLDSAQLVRFEPFPSASWADIGSGAGLPGIVIACLVEGPVTLIEPRKLRAEFLHRAVVELSLNATVAQAKVEAVEGAFDAITARAVAPTAKLFAMAQHLSTGKTVWILPKGRRAESELAEARRQWQGSFHVEQSATKKDSGIIVAANVTARRG